MKFRKEIINKRSISDNGQKNIVIILDKFLHLIILKRGKVQVFIIFYLKLIVKSLQYIDKKGVELLIFLS